MALYSKKYNFIFIHIFKAGGNSIRQLLGEKEDYTKEMHNAHIWVRDVKTQFYKIGEKDFYDNAFKFAFVRHPYQWITSLYFYIRFAKGHGEHSRVKHMSIDDFVLLLVNSFMKRQKIYGQHAYYKLHEFLCDEKGKMEMDYVGKMENMNTDMKLVCESLDLNYERPPLKNINKNYDNAKDYLSIESKKLIDKVFDLDFKMFEYQKHDEDEIEDEFEDKFIEGEFEEDED